MGTHQGAVSHKHLDYYLDEFTFRFNRRRSTSRGKLFFRLVQQAVAVEPVPLDRIIHPGTKVTDRACQGRAFRAVATGSREGGSAVLSASFSAREAPPSPSQSESTRARSSSSLAEKFTLSPKVSL